MYLRSLELVGFKSFATRTLLEFQPGVTAIVGPNGCGKSNVLDAIRWVLGEQSAKALRGSEMADVIFSGTESRSPLSMAEVSLTFTDCQKDLGVEWNEVCITRRIYRDGKSDYLINRTPCRLRDIQELFMDTGIGRSAYSIMEQGKIDQILSSKPEDRRAIFEEAAGITRYKTQKREALRKLELTEANLLRVSDILAEHKRQLKSLERQAAKARNYLQLHDSLLTLESHLAHHHFSSHQLQSSSLQSQIHQLESQRDQLAASIPSLEGEILSLKTQINSLDENIAHLRDQHQRTETALLSAQNRIESNHHRIQESRELLHRNQAEISHAQQLLTEHQSRLHQTEALLQEILLTLNKNHARLRDAESSLANTRKQLAQTERLLHQLTSSQSQQQNQAAQLQATISSASAFQQVTEARLAALHEELNQAHASSSQNQAQLQSLQHQLSSLDSQIASLQSEISALSSHAAQLQEQSAHLASHRASTERSLAESQSKLTILQQLESSGEGYDQATQALLRPNPPSPTPPSGTLASHLTVPPELAPAIEAALGPLLQTVLYPDPSALLPTALALRQQNLGRAYLAAPSSPPTPPPDHPQLPPQALSWALDAIQAPSHLHPLLLSLLHNVAITPDLPTSLALHSAHPHLAFASLDGHFLASSGILATSPTPQPASSPLLRKHQIHQLHAQIQSLQTSLAQSSAQLETLNAQTNHTLDQLDSKRQTLHELELQRSSLLQQIVNLQHLSAEANARSSSLQREKDSLLASLHQNQLTLQQAQEALQTLLAEQQLALQNRSALEEKLTSLRELEASQAEQLNQIRIQIATEQQRNESLLREQKPIQSRLVELSNLLDSRQKENQALEAKIASLQEEITSLQDQVTSHQQRLSHIVASVHQLLDQREQLNHLLEKANSSLLSNNKKISHLNEQIGNLQVQLAQTQLHLENIAEQILRKYQIHLESFEPNFPALLQLLPPTHDPTNIPWNLVKEKVAELSQRIESLGPVNLDAIKEYDELLEHHNFLQKQFLDLSNSKQQLTDFIQRINQTTKKLFSQTFEKIRANFQEMFAQLFGGGKATLQLLDSDDPLESGIEIIAKPPGKKLQNISLLSGGERTMTAVALLFAIYMVKPSPFCVLDEMDAPLDESNIKRFIEILDRFVSQSQFLVITHNKRTISRADIIYGVTMEEHGVSKIVSVNFRQKAPANSSTADETPGISEALTAKK